MLYAGAERLDAQRCTLGEPPLTDGAVLCLGAPAEPGPDLDDVSAQLHVVAGPDAGGVHLLHGGQIHVGRSARADVPLDDPDVSRLHCAVTVTPDGRVSVADTGSTNGTTLDGARVGERPVRFTEGALLRVGESALRLAPPGGPGALATAPDGEGHVRVSAGAPRDAPDGGSAGPLPSSAPSPSASPDDRQPHGAVPHARGDSASLFQEAPCLPRTRPTTPTAPPSGGLRGRGPRNRGVRAVRGSEPPVVPEQGGAPRIEGGPRGGASAGARGRPGGSGGHAGTTGEWPEGAPEDTFGAGPGIPGARKGTPMRGTDVPAGMRRRGGLGAWARRLTGSRGGPEGAAPEAWDDGALVVRDLPTAVHRSPETWPDPAALLLTALGRAPGSGSAAPVTRRP